MRYYCKECGSEFNFSEIGFAYFHKRITDAPKCAACNYPLVEVPDYETVEQWEARTGHEYPKNAPIYSFNKVEDRWKIFSYLPDAGFSNDCVVATKLGFPPFYWRKQE